MPQIAWCEQVHSYKNTLRPYRARYHFCDEVLVSDEISYQRRRRLGSNHGSRRTLPDLYGLLFLSDSSEGFQIGAKIIKSNAMMRMNVNIINQLISANIITSFYLFIYFHQLLNKYPEIYTTLAGNRTGNSEGHFLIWPRPVRIYLVVVISRRPIGPRGPSFCVLIPISAPSPN